MVCWMLFKSWQLPKWLEGAIGPYKESTSEKPKWRSPTDLSELQPTANNLNLQGK